MSFIGEVASWLGLSEAALALGYTAVNYDGKAVYIEGVRKILKIDTDEMAFGLKKGILRVSGVALEASELTKSAVLVRGEIHSITSSGGESK